MDFQDIISILSTPIPLTNIKVGNVLIAVILLIIGYLVVALVVRYIRHAMRKENLLEAPANRDANNAFWIFVEESKIRKNTCRVC